MADKSRFGPELTEAGIFHKTIILLGLAGYKMIITNEAFIYHFISSMFS